MDNKTHMMFHDQEIREKTRKQDFRIFKQVNLWRDEGLSEQAISERLKANFNLTEQEIHEYILS